MKPRPSRPVLSMLSLAAALALSACVYPAQAPVEPLQAPEPAAVINPVDAILPVHLDGHLDRTELVALCGWYGPAKVAIGAIPDGIPDNRRSAYHVAEAFIDPVCADPDAVDLAATQTQLRAQFRVIAAVFLVRAAAAAL